MMEVPARLAAVDLKSLPVSGGPTLHMALHACLHVLPVFLET